MIKRSLLKATLRGRVCEQELLVTSAPPSPPPLPPLAREEGGGRWGGGGASRHEKLIRTEWNPKNRYEIQRPSSMLLTYMLPIRDQFHQPFLGEFFASLNQLVVVLDQKLFLFYLWSKIFYASDSTLAKQIWNVWLYTVFWFQAGRPTILILMVITCMGGAQHCILRIFAKYALFVPL